MTELSLLERTTIVTRLFSAIQFYFAHWQDTTIDLDAALPELIQMALDTPDRFQFGLEMLKFISKLNNSHTWYRDPHFAQYTQPHAYTLMPDHWMVEKSYVDSLCAGDVLTHIDGKPLSEWFQRVRPYMNASSERVARVLFSDFLHLFVPPTYTVITDDGREVTVDHKTATPPTPIHNRETNGHWLEDQKIAYINIPSFNWTKFEQKALDYMREFKDAACLIIDLRECGGGTTPSQLIDALMTQPYRMWMEGTPLNFALFHYRQIEYQRRLAAKDPMDDKTVGYYETMSEMFRHPMLVWDAPLQTPKPIYTGKIILLIGNHVGSAGEDFVVPFKNSGRAALVGTSTFGSTGQPYFYNFENGIQIAVGTKRAYFPDGSRYEGYGIAPDVEVQPTRKGLRAGRDEVLERAIELAHL